MTRPKIAAVPERDPWADRSDARERLALALARNRMQRTTARILAAFVFTDDRSLTLGDVGMILNISAASASTGVRSLVDQEVLEQVPVPGSRRDHFRLRDDAWAKLFWLQNAPIGGIRDAARNALTDLDPPSPAAERLERLQAFYDSILGGLPELIACGKTPHPRAECD